MFNGFFQNQFNNIGQNNLFNNLFEQMGNGYAFPEDNQPQQRRDNKPPPASKRAINNLPVVQITADDLIEETNKECLICLESHVIGMMSSKLPCGHLFHKPCLAEWLVKQCTCPVCRYELETEDAQFEASRKQRMKDRKLRFRKDELKNHSIHQLKELCGKLSISTADCLDKQEIVEKIIRSGKVIVTDGIPPIEMTEEDFHVKNVSELKHLLLAFGLSSEGALEKSDLRNRLLESGRIVLITATSSSSNGKMEIDEGSKSTPSKSTDNAAQVKGGLKGGFGDFENYISYSREELRNMSLSGLRELCKRYQIDITTCLDKSEVIENMIRARNFPVKPDSTIESNSYKEPDLVFQQTSSSSQPPTRSRANSQHGASPSSFIRSRSSSRDPSFSNSRKRSLSNGSSNSYNEPTVIMPPYAHTINAQEPNYSPRSNSSDYYNTEPLDQAINYIGHFLQSTATDLSSQFQAMYQQSTRSRSSSNAPSTPPIAISRASNSTTSTPPQPPRISPNGNGEEHRERLVLSRELLESFSILEIKMILDSYGINSQNCVDKFDHIHALEHSTFVEIVD